MAPSRFFKNVILASHALLFSNQSFAEYRAFLLKISTPPKEEKKNTKSDNINDPSQKNEQDLKTSESQKMIEYFVKSTLDPIQYRGYYHADPKAIITYVDTWRCPGRTGGLKSICKSPKELKAELEKSKDPSLSPSQNAPTPTSSPERVPANQ